jgi:hypothetical protein
MSTYRAVTVEFEECQRLIDLSSVHRDFERCKNMCDSMVIGRSDQSFDMVILDSFATAIPIVYWRGFNTGVRSSVSMESFLDGLSESDREFHKQINTYRNRYTAHSVNRMEQDSVRVWLNPEEKPGGRKINNINTCSTVSLTLSLDDYLRLSDLCERAISWLKKEKENEKTRLVEIVQKKYSLDELYAMKDKAIDILDGLDQAHRGRKRLDGK